MMLLRLDDFARHFKARRAEWLLASFAFSIGMSYLSTPGLFAMPMFSIMRTMGSQEHWGWAITVVAFIRLIMLWINGRWKVTPYMRATGAFLCAGLWFLLFMLQSYSTMPSQARWAWLVLLVFDMLNAGDAAFDAGTIRQKQGGHGA